MSKNSLMQRPFATHYYSSAGDSEPSFTRCGAAKTEEGAIRATVVRIFMGQYAKAIIHDRATGVALYHVIVGAGGLRIRYGSGVQFKTSPTAPAQAANYKGF